LTAQSARSALVLAMVVLPWVAAPHLGDGSNRHRSTVDTDAAIESVPTLELVTADRPTVSPSAKRSDGFRLVSSNGTGGGHCFANAGEFDSQRFG